MGKSSLINALADNRQLAKISSTPGKTRLIIYFNVDEKLLLTDLPGYGFAQVSQQTRVAFSALADRYLESGRPIALVLHLLDIRHDPSIQDLQMIEWLKSRNLESFVILSKSDKLSRSQALRRRKEIAAAIGVDQPGSLIILSAQNKTGIDELRARITSFFPPKPRPDQLFQFVAGPGRTTPSVSGKLIPLFG